MTKKRTRRSPEEARVWILDAADRVFAGELPDAVGLKDVAREAGVSHALVTHYFGTYAALVEATLERRFDRMRDALVRDLVAGLDARSPSEPADVGAMLTAYRRVVASVASDPVTVRLAVWAVLSGRADAADFISHRRQGLRQLADALEARSGLPREDLEFAIVASLAMTVVWTFGRRALGGALGKKAALDTTHEAKTAAMIDAYLARVKRAK
jgi:AcrR family transcriptional regulator